MVYVRAVKAASGATAVQIVILIQARVWQNYHGPVLLCGVNDRGDSIDLTRAQLVGLLTHLMDAADKL